jgi:hypothetical protein
VRHQSTVPNRGSLIRKCSLIGKLIRINQRFLSVVAAGGRAGADDTPREEVRKMVISKVNQAIPVCQTTKVG